MDSYDSRLQRWVELNIVFCPRNPTLDKRKRMNEWMDVYFTMTRVEYFFNISLKTNARRASIWIFMGEKISSATLRKWYIVTAMIRLFYDSKNKYKFKKKISAFTDMSSIGRACLWWTPKQWMKMKNYDLVPVQQHLCLGPFTVSRLLYWKFSISKVQKQKGEK